MKEIKTINHSKDRIIVALDTSNPAKFEELVKLLGDKVGYFKVGLEALSAPGLGYERSVGIIKDAGGKVFLDVKLHDIGETLRKTTLNLSRLGVDMVNVHLTGSKESAMMVKENAGEMIVLGVTLLTDISNDECAEDYGLNSFVFVKRMTIKAQSAKLDGIVCSAVDLRYLANNHIGENLIKVTPGIRPHWSAANDQKRILAPSLAIQAGADFLVIGRPITDPPESVGKDPLVAVQKIVEELDNAMPTW